MGTTAEKGARVLQSIAEVQEGINNLGGSLTDQTPFKDFKAQLDEIYNNLPKTEYQEGTEINLGVTSKGKLDFDNGVVGIGQTEQDSTTGTQRMDTTEYIPETTKNGVTYSLKDGVFTFNGTATAGIDVFCQNKFALESGTYTIAPSDTSGSYTGVFGKYAYVSGSWNIIDGGQVRQLMTKTIESDYTNVQCHLYIASGAVFNNYKFKVNLVKGTYTEQSIPAWEKYTGGQASPNPSYPQEIKYVRGKNRLNNTLTNKTQQGIEFIVNEDKTIKANGTATGTSGVVIGQVQLTANETYTLSGCASNGGSGKYTLSISPNGETTRLVDDTGSGATYTPTTSGIYDIRLNYWYGFNIQNLTFKPMLEKGSTATSYLPYNTIEEVVSGINIIGLDTNQYKVDLKIGDKITFKNEGTQALTLNLYTNYGDTTRNDFWSIGVNATRIITVAHDTKAIAWEVAPNGLAWGNYGDTLSSYEPYITPTSYQLSLGDIELNAIGNYRDYIYKNNGKWYVHKETNKVTLDGTETGERYDTSTANSFFVINKNVDHYKLSSGNISSLGLIYCDKLIGNAISGSGSIYYNNNGISYGTTGTFYKDFVVYIEECKEMTFAQLQNWLSTNNLLIYYILATPTDTEITDTTLISQLENWYNAHSNNGTTIITSNGDLPMIIKVRGLKGE